MLSKEKIAEMAKYETALLHDFKIANNYIGVKIQKAKIKLLDDILEL